MHAKYWSISGPCIVWYWNSYELILRAGAATWSNPDYRFGGKYIACTDQGQDFTYPNNGYAGQIQTVPESIKDYSIKVKPQLKFLAASLNS